jgi:DNA-binding MarR family transcriptional regulator
VDVAREELIDQILDFLLVMGGNVERLTGAAAGYNKLNRTDLRALRILRSGGLTAGDLARALNVTSGATTRVIDSLVAAGHVQREADPRDRRRVLVSLTPPAERIVDTTFERLRDDTRSALQVYSDRELAALAKFLADLDALVQAHARRLSAPADR